MPLRGIPTVLTPEILHCLSSMGHGDELVLADAHFPASSVCKTSVCGTLEIRADACSSISYLLECILKLVPLDEYADSAVFLMDLVDSDKAAKLEVPAWKEFEQVLSKHTPNGKAPSWQPHLLERFEFYERAKKAFAVIQTGLSTIICTQIKSDLAKYGNIIIKKGCVLD